MTLVFVQATSTVAQAKDGSPTGDRRIVVFKNTIDVAGKEKALSRSGATAIKYLSSVNAAAVVVTAGSEKALLELPEVAYVIDDAVAHIDGKPVKPGKPLKPSPAEQLPWGVDRIDADLVWARGIRGTGVKIAVLDTGIDLDHPDLAANIKGSYNATHHRKRADDDNGHGTHVAGIIAARDNSTGVIGVAPEASLYAVKVLDKDGAGYVSDIIEGLEWCVRNGIQVVNMSFSLDTDEDLLHEAIIKAHSAGVTIVAAAGNSGPGAGVQYPAKYPEVIAVSASDNSDAIIAISSTGPEVALAAPGWNIPSTYSGDTYMTMYGTSMAAPHVTGTVALVLSASRRLRPEQVRERLTASATDLGDPGQDESYGYGLVDAAAAVNH